MENQTFPVIYQNERLMVDPALLCNSSKKFRELLENAPTFETLHLLITSEIFSFRNVSNFLKICQNQQTDVQNSELEEICLIAKMFQADEIYNTAINFIKSTINPNFFIPENQFNESNGEEYLLIESDEEKELVHHVDLKELEFDDSCEFTSVVQVDDSKNNNDISTTTNTQDHTEKKKKPRLHSAIYQITSDNRFMKCPRYFFSKDNQVLYMAKIKENEIYIGEGQNFHISENKIENTARITRDCRNYNVVNTDDQEFKVKFLQYGTKYSLNTTFSHHGTQLTWRPKGPKNESSYNGEYNHVPKPSRKNIILQNTSNHVTFILRKMSKKSFEVECHPGVSPLVVFSIAISQITGPVVTMY